MVIVSGELLVRPKYASTTEEKEIPSTHGVCTGEDYLLPRRSIFLSRNSISCAAEQFHRDASLETMDRRALNNSKNWQWTTEGDVSARWLLFAPHGPEWPNNFPQSVGSILIYCYRCRNMGFVIRQLLLHRGLLAKVPLYRIPLTPNAKPLTVASAIGSWAQSLASWFTPSCLFRWIMLHFVCNHDACVHVRHYAGQCCLPESVIEWYSG